MQAPVSVLACACAVLAAPVAALSKDGGGRGAASTEASVEAAGAATRQESVTIRLTSVTMIATQHLKPPRDRPRKGDFIDFRDLLVNRGLAQFGKKPGKAVAWDEGLIFYTSATSTEIQVRVTFPGLGTITYEGLVVSDAHGNSVVPVIAGTGAFKGARGTVTIGSGTGSSPNTFRLVLPGHPIDLSSGGGAA